MATKTLREELLDLLVGSAPRPSPCHGYVNCCTCSQCEARGDQNALMIYAENRGVKIDRPTAKQLLIRHPKLRIAKRVVDEMVSAKQRKMAA